MTQIHDPAVHKLGKAPRKHDDRTLQLADYLGTHDEMAYEPPPIMDRTELVASWPMYLNDELGDCVFAGAGHEVQVQTLEGHHAATPSDQDILTAYEQVTGYSPNEPGSDRGTVVLDALNYRRKVGIGGHTLGAYAELEPRNHAAAKTAIWLFGAVGIGLALPIAAQNQRTWHVTRGQNGVPGSWGGHYVPLFGYDSHGLICVTWGAVKRMTWPFFNKYCDEAYALLSAEVLSNGVSPEGFNLTQLQQDLQGL